ncbi:Lacal_2735 family protein [Flavobacteriaceae bacterium S356]|uniref:Lacal_2735 family protein n=1 Tax=Asprobacillus argus TaxID=3076534 RepID=A0ABU3LGH4_9FLAO|nr:Lacal_2735 family protein [Flavobacteriaceae bacterium S356]
MSLDTPLYTYTQHLKKRYRKLLEKSNAYRIIDEPISDMAAFKAMKIMKKLDQLKYLSN